MAYLRELHHSCTYPGCPASAVVEVVNRVNAPQGKFCRRHGRIKLKDLLRNEGATEAHIKAALTPLPVLQRISRP